MTKKTLGQVAFDAYQGSTGYALDYGEWDSMHPDWRAAWEDVAESVAAEVVRALVNQTQKVRTKESCEQCQDEDLKGIHTCGR